MKKKNNKCNKKKFSRIGALLALASAISPSNKKHKRQEKRSYTCPECGAIHLTSKPARGTTPP